MSSDFFRCLRCSPPPVAFRCSLPAWTAGRGDPEASFFFRRYDWLAIREYFTDSLVELAFSLRASWSPSFKAKWNSDSSWSIAKVDSSICE